MIAIVNRFVPIKSFKYTYIKYLAKGFGLEKVMTAFKKLKRKPTDKDFNYMTFFEVFGKSVAEVEEEWLDSLA